MPFRHDFITHSIYKTQSYKPEEVYVRQGDFDSLTSYNQEYTRKRLERNRDAFKRLLIMILAKGGERAQMIRHEDHRTAQGPFEGDPTYRSKI